MLICDSFLFVRLGDALQDKEFFSQIAKTCIEYCLELDSRYDIVCVCGGVYEPITEP